MLTIGSLMNYLTCEGRQQQAGIARFRASAKTLSLQTTTPLDSPQMPGIVCLSAYLRN
jgi:hypothetical protein